MESNNLSTTQGAWFVMPSAVPRVDMKNIYRASLVAVPQAVSEVSYPSAASAAPPWGGLGDMCIFHRFFWLGRVWMELQPGNYRSAKLDLRAACTVSTLAPSRPHIGAKQTSLRLSLSHYDI